jgi:hypothetical protein
VELGDAKFPSRILRKLFLSSGEFIAQGKDDHRYKGIPNAWIRYVSQGTAALRVIYLKDGDALTLYRAGPHAVEDDLAQPPADAPFEVLVDPIAVALRSIPGNHTSLRNLAESNAAMGLEASRAAQPVVSGEDAKSTGLDKRRLLHNHAERFLYGNLLGRRFLPHKDVYLMSPYVSLDMLRPTSLFGQMLDELVLDGATVNLITRPPLRTEEFREYEQLAARRINSFFSRALHAKVYAFRLDRERLRPDDTKYDDFLAVGSANLTWNGVNPSGLLSDNIQYELSYHVPHEDWDDVEAFLLHVAHLGVDFEALRASFV